MKKKKLVNSWFDYTVVGTLEKTESNITPTQFVVKGKRREKGCVDGKIYSQTDSNCSILIPEGIGKESSFLEVTPLGTRISFRELNKRIDGKMYIHTYSFRILGQKKTK